jgi:hypothetical protein
LQFLFAGGFGLLLLNIKNEEWIVSFGSKTFFMMMRMWRGRPWQLFWNVQNKGETIVETVVV